MLTTISRLFGWWPGMMQARSTRLESSRCRASAEPAGNRKPDLVPYAARGSVSGMTRRPPRSIQGENNGLAYWRSNDHGRRIVHYKQLGHLDDVPRIRRPRSREMV